MFMPTRGEQYTREEIAATHGGSVVEYLPRAGGRVVCACLRTDPDYNPEAPRVILAGRGRDIEESAAILAEQEGPIPVYLKRAINAWEYVGGYEAESSSQLPDDIVRYETQTGRKVTRAIFMREAPDAA
jgi:hypothetical protein